MNQLKIVDSVIMEKENYKSVTYEYDKKTDIVVTKADNQFGNLENITLVTKTVKIIPYHAFVNFLADGNKKVEVTLKFNTPMNWKISSIQTMKNFGLLNKPQRKED